MSVRALDPGWKAAMLEQLQQDLTSLKSFFRQQLSDAAMAEALGAVESCVASGGGGRSSAGAGLTDKPTQNPTAQRQHRQLVRRGLGSGRVDS
jgi:hypothetical protein